MAALDDELMTIEVLESTSGLTLAGIASVAVNLEYPGERPPGKDAEHVDGFLFVPGKTDPRTFTTFLNDRRKVLAAPFTAGQENQQLKLPRYLIAS